MKKFLISGICLLVLGMLPVSAGINPASLDKASQKQDLVSNIGFRLLNANRIQQRMVFSYVDKKVVNAVAYYRDRSIVIYDGIMKYTTDEDMVAAILAHEISHGIDYYNGIFRGYFSCLPTIFTPRKYERKADKRAIDFMVNAGYNPVAMIVMMNKIMPQRRFEVFETHPLVSRRMAYVYEYIYYKYPEFLKNNKYIDDVYYQNFLLNSQDNRRKLQNKIEGNTRGNVKYD
ncbi:MAG: M48 family metallopeptidase [Brachyspira sp.]|nr:M48 family metallopeptidase [Brachyspira sp.]